jgi:putative membrane protein
MVKFGKPRWDLRKVKEAVVDAEAHTSGEIVPMIVELSGEYSEVRYFIALFLVFLGSIVAWLFAEQFPWTVELNHLLLGQLMLAVLGWLLGSLPPLVRLCAGKKRMSENVHSAALAAYLRHGLSETRDRTGVLIYVSMLEHRVEILGDRGIHEKVGEGFWLKETEQLVKGIRADRAVDALAEVIQDIGAKLKEYFPKKTDDSNELDDHLRMR